MPRLRLSWCSLSLKINLTDEATRAVECGDEVLLGVISYNVQLETLCVRATVNNSAEEVHAILSQFGLETRIKSAD